MDEAIRLLIDFGFRVVDVNGNRITVECPPTRELS